MKNSFLKVICFLTIVSIQAQNENDGVRIILEATKGSISNSSFYKYTPPFKAKAIYNDTIQAVNKYPEQLMSSIMSENSEAWYYYNNLEENEIPFNIKKRFTNVVNLNKDKNYMELLHKFEFEMAGVSYAIIKFKLIVEEREKASYGAYSLIKIGDKWKKTASPSIFKLTMFNALIKTDKLDLIFKGVKTEDDLVNNVIENVYDNRILNIEKLLTLFQSWLSTNNTVYINNFIQNPNWSK